MPLPSSARAWVLCSWWSVGPRALRPAWGRSRKRRVEGLRRAWPLRGSEEPYNKVHLGGRLLQPQQGGGGQEVIGAGVGLAFAFEKDVETQKGTGLLIFRPWTVRPGPRPSPPQPPPASSQLLTREVGGRVWPTVLNPSGAPSIAPVFRAAPSPYILSGSQKWGWLLVKQRPQRGQLKRNWDDPTGCLSARLALGP